MKRKWIFFIPVFIALFILIGGEVVLHLWNWLAPALFGLKQITFWQAVGLLALCRILFGGFSGRGSHGPNFRKRMSGHWNRMSEEEREKFRQVMRSGGGFGPPTSGTQEPA
jgi:hypothetical protein